VTIGDYCVEITQDNKALGAGFLLTKSFVLTALHCLDGLAPNNDEVNISIAGRESVPGRVYRRSPEADLALIDIPRLDSIQSKIPDADRAVRGENWRSPYRPSTKHAQISGKIDAFPVKYHCEGGGEIEALQLECEQPLGDYSGYSGGPVERNCQDDNHLVLGLLIEQYPDQYPDHQIPTRASNVLFAAAISEVFRRFDCFDVSNLRKVRPPSDETPSSVQPEERIDDTLLSPRTSVDSRISVADAKLRAIRKWEEDGLLDGLDAAALAALKLRVVQSIVASNLRETA
jgi:Trypsin-like peptidase domain